MSDTKENGGTKDTGIKDTGTVGKRYRGDNFPPVKTEFQAVEESDQRAETVGNPDAMDIEAYFAIKKVRSPAAQAGMRAYTTVRSATLEDWNKIFESF